MGVTRDYVKKSVRAAAILTDAFVAGTTLEITEGYDQLVMLIDFTKGSLTSVEVKVEFSPDNTNFYQETFQAISSGTATESLGVHTFTATGKYRVMIPILDRYIKISADGTGTLTDSSLAIDAILGFN
jgi:hypothetical protein